MAPITSLKHILLSLLSLTPLLQQAQAWNTDVHIQIAYAAFELVNNSTKEILPEILKKGIPPPPPPPPSSASSPISSTSTSFAALGKPAAVIPESDYMRSLPWSAAWADYFANVPAGAYSKMWHYIDTEDNPPSKCSLDFGRDCVSVHSAEGDIDAASDGPKGCVISALANQTVILGSCIRDELLLRRKQPGAASTPTTYDDRTCAQALMWTIHFNGDINQPLHASGKAYGGNTAMVKFGGVVARLHDVWDGRILYSLISHENADQSEPPVTPAPFVPRALSNATIHPHFVSLVHRIKKHPETFLSEPETWIQCADPSSRESALKCATSWASESNRVSCNYTWGRLPWVVKSKAVIPAELQLRQDRAELPHEDGAAQQQPQHQAQQQQQQQLLHQDGQPHEHMHLQLYTPHHHHHPAHEDGHISTAAENDAMAMDFASIGADELIPDLNVDLLYDVDLRYAEGAWSVVDTQLGKSVLRMATWLDRIVEAAERDV